MNTTKRLIFQILFWLFIWVVLWSQQYWDMPFIFQNINTFIVQILLIIFLIYYTGPQFLFKKKYVLFILASFIAIGFLSYLSTHTPPPRDFPRPSKFHRPPGGRPPSKLLTQALLISIAYFLATVIEFISFTHKKEEEIIRSKNEHLQTELKLLKSQINPHFLFNSLNNIYALSAIDPQKTQDSICYLSDMLRYVLYECERPYVALQKEMDYIENYIQLFSLKSSKKFPIKTSFKLSKPSVKIAPMVLIPFVENAFKHSNIDKFEDTFIHLSIHAEKDNIVFKIENTFKHSNIAKDGTGGIGLENVNKRLAILYPQKHSLKITKKEGVFKVTLNLKTNV